MNGNLSLNPGTRLKCRNYEGSPLQGLSEARRGRLPVCVGIQSEFSRGCPAIDMAELQVTRRYRNRGMYTQRGQSPQKRQ